MIKKKKEQKITNEVLCAEYEAVYHYALSICRNETEAQDITQETFMKAINATDSFKGNSSLYTWLCTIAKNLWINRCRKQRREIIPENMIQNRNSEQPAIEQYIVEKEMALYIHKILHNMSEPYKEVFSLRVFGQLPFIEIANLFSKTESWARVTYHRARKIIYEQMEKEGYYD